MTISALGTSCHAAFAACLIPFIAVATSGAHPASEHRLAEIEAQLARTPDDPQLYLSRGELHRSNRNWACAREDFTIARELSPGLAAIDLHLGRLELDAGRAAEAIAHLDALVKTSDDDGRALSLRARARAALGDHVGATADYDGAIASCPGAGPDLFLQRSRVLLAAGDEHQVNALAGLEEGLRRLGSVPTLQLAAMDIELKLERTDAALARLGELEARASRPGRWRLRRAEVLAEANRSLEARAVLGAILRSLRDASPAESGHPRSERLLGEANALLERLDASRDEVGRPELQP